MRKRKIGPTDQNHVAKINSFIPEADKPARRVIAGDDYTGVGGNPGYTREFHVAMNELTAAAGLRVV